MFAPILPSQPQVNLNRPLQNVNQPVSINKPITPSQNVQNITNNFNSQIQTNSQFVKPAESSEQLNNHIQKNMTNGIVTQGEKPMFNVNHGSEKQNSLTLNIPLPNQMSLHITNMTGENMNSSNLNNQISENKYQIISNTDLQINNNTMMRNPNFTNIVSNTNNVSMTNTMTNQTSSQMQNYAEYIRRQNIKFKKLYDVYQADPIKFKREIGSDEFVKFENVLKSKNIPLAKMDMSQSQN